MSGCEGSERIFMTEIQNQRFLFVPDFKNELETYDRV